MEGGETARGPGAHRKAAADPGGPGRALVENPGSGGLGDHLAAVVGDDLLHSIRSEHETRVGS